MTRNFTKPSLNIEQQIAHLRANGMIIDAEDVARYWLTHVSYYRLSAYWLYFEREKGDEGPRFAHGTRFEAVTALYDFDRGLRRLVMRGTEHIEVALRASWAYQIALLDHGHAYLDAGLYGDRKQFHDNLAKLAKDVGESNETYVDHYRRTYREPALPPAWMVAEMMSLGQLSRWFSSLNSRSLRNRIALPLGLTETVMVPFIRHLVDVRNICAHHGRLWNRGFLICPRLPSKPRDLQMSLDLAAAAEPPARLYNSLTMMIHIVRNVAPASNWALEIRDHLLQHPNGDLQAMGFPDDWQERPLWA